MSRFTLAISHTPWVPERVESYKTLHKALGLEEGGIQWRFDMPFLCVDGKAPNNVWSLRMWKWAFKAAHKHAAAWCLFLQDDTIVSPYFWEDLAYLVDHADNADFPIIGLQAPHPAARELAKEGRYHGFSTTDGLIGVGYAVRRDELGKFLEWRAANVDAGIEKVSEDTMLGMYAAATGALVYHPLPTIVDHNTALPSTYANDAHDNRSSAVRWDSDYVAPRDDDEEAARRVPHLGRFYDATPRLLATYTHTPSEVIAAIVDDDGKEEARRIRHAALGRREGGRATARLWVGTPSRGDLSAGYVASMLKLKGATDIDVACSVELEDVQVWNYDVVRARNRMARHFLENTRATHLLFVDADITFSPQTIGGMLGVNEPFVASPYPKRAGVNWDRVHAGITSEGYDPATPPEAFAYAYSVRLDGESRVDEARALVSVGGIGFGCVLLQRAALQVLYNTCLARGEKYLDILPDGSKVETANMFGLITTPDGALLSEDFSFCRRWREAGNTVWMYLGAGSPVDHDGQHTYQGHIEAFGLKREVAK